MKTRPILAVGDPHGNWRPLLDACASVRPAAVLLLGDCDLARPLRETLAPLWAAGTSVYYVVGNHDTDTAEWWTNLVDDHPTGNLHGRAVTIGGLRIAGLGGIYQQDVWWPRAADEDLGPHCWNRDDWRQENAHRRFRTHPEATDSTGLPLRLRSAIFPEDHELLDVVAADGGVDVLITHDAPPTHRHGFLGIQRAAEACGARLLIHGHHHDSYTATLPNGCVVRGLGRAEPWVLEF